MQSLRNLIIKSMKKLFYSLCAIASLFTIHSCTNDISEDFISQKKIKLTQDEVFSISYEETKDLEEKTLFDMVNAFAKLLQKSEMRKDIVIELSYKGFG